MMVVKLDRLVSVVDINTSTAYLGAPVRGENADLYLNLSSFVPTTLIAG